MVPVKSADFFVLSKVIYECIIESTYLKVLSHESTSQRVTKLRVRLGC